MTSNRLIFLVLISLLLMGIPLENAEKATLSETENVSSVIEDFEDYDLYLDKKSENNIITTVEPGSNEETVSLFGDGITFYTSEMISDLNAKGKTS